MELTAQVFGEPPHQFDAQTLRLRLVPIGWQTDAVIGDLHMHDVPVTRHHLDHHGIAFVLPGKSMLDGVGERLIEDQSKIHRLRDADLDTGDIEMKDDLISDTVDIPQIAYEIR